jgi:hypothetical protein
MGTERSASRPGRFTSEERTRWAPEPVWAKERRKVSQKKYVKEARKETRRKMERKIKRNIEKEQSEDIGLLRDTRNIYCP